LPNGRPQFTMPPPTDYHFAQWGGQIPFRPPAHTHTRVHMHRAFAHASSVHARVVRSPTACTDTRVMRRCAPCAAPSCARRSSTRVLFSHARVVPPRAAPCRHPDSVWRHPNSVWRHPDPCLARCRCPAPAPYMCLAHPVCPTGGTGRVCSCVYVV